MERRFVKELDGGVAEKAQLGLGHSYSRGKVGRNVFVPASLRVNLAVFGLYHNAIQWRSVTGTRKIGLDFADNPPLRSGQTNPCTLLDIVLETKGFIWRMPHVVAPARLLQKKPTMSAVV